MMRPIVKGSTDQSVIVRVVDSADGTPESPAYNTAGVDLWYRREGGLRVAITEATLAAVDSAHSDGGFIHISDGYCRLDLPDAAFATGANGVMVGGTFTGMVVIGCYVPLWDINPYDAVRAGMTALPNAAAEAAGGLYTRGTGAGQINQPSNGLINANATQFAGQTISAAAGVTLPSSVASPTNITAGTITTVTNLTNAPTAGDFTATMKASINTEADTALADYDGPTNAEMVARTLAAASYATAAALATVDSIVDDILVDTAEIGAAGAGLTNINLPDQAMNITGNITGNLSGSVGSLTANNDKTGYRLSTTGVADFWAYVVEGAWTAVQFMRLFASALVGESSGMGTNTGTFRDIDDTKDRIVVTQDADGNRSAFATKDGD